MQIPEPASAMRCNRVRANTLDVSHLQLQSVKECSPGRKPGETKQKNSRSSEGKRISACDLVSSRTEHGRPQLQILYRRGNRKSGQHPHGTKVTTGWALLFVSFHDIMPAQLLWMTFTRAAKMRPLTADFPGFYSPHPLSCGPGTGPNSRCVFPSRSSSRFENSRRKVHE